MRPQPTVWRQAAKLAGVLLLVIAVFPSRAHAYIDPVSGSIILQVLAAGALAAAFTFKRFTHSIRHFVRTTWARIQNR